MQIYPIPLLTLAVLVPVANAQSLATRPAAAKPATTQQATTQQAKRYNPLVEGIPPIQRDVIERAARYTEFRAALPPSWHPVRREMLIATRFADTAQVHYVKMPGGARTQMTFSKEPIDNGSFQPTEGESFVYSTDVGGSEFDQLFRFDLATGESTLLTDGKSRNSRGPWSRDGKWIAYTSTRRTGADSDLYVVNPADKSTDRRVAEVKGGGWSPADWSPEGKTLLVGEYVSINESYLWLFDVKTGERTEFTPRNVAGGEKVAYDDAVFARDGKGVYATTDKESQF